MGLLETSETAEPHSVRVTNFAKIADSRVRVSARRRVRVRVFCEISVTTRLQVEKLIDTGRVLRRRAQIRSQILCAVNMHPSATLAKGEGSTGLSWVNFTRAVCFSYFGCKQNRLSSEMFRSAPCHRIWV